jgi:pyruvate,water dikinase
MTTGIAFNQGFFSHARNTLVELLPDAAHLEHVVRVIDVPVQTDGQVLRILMNADLDQGLGFLDTPSTTSDEPGTLLLNSDTPNEQHWRWRMRMAECIAQRVDAGRFGVKAMYIFGSTKNATAGPTSDIDLIIHDHGDATQRRMLDTWLDGWSLTLSEMNYLRTGYQSNGLVDAHYVTDDDIARKSSYASKIGAVTDAARPLPLR